jgi:hypothetical protein
MAGPREQFRDGAGALATYPFTVNHRDEEPTEQTRNISRQAVTTGPKFVLQQGEPSPRVLRYTGAILTSEQLNAMQAYYDACATRTVFFRDVSGVEYEVLIIRFAPQRKPVLYNTRDPTLRWYWTYSLDMEIVR